MARRKRARLIARENEKLSRMTFGMIAIAALGFVTGLMFKVKMLFPIVGLVLIASVIFSSIYGTSVSATALIVIAAQAVLQICYFIGVTVSTWFKNPPGSVKSL